MRVTSLLSVLSTGGRVNSLGAVCVSSLSTGCVFFSLSTEVCVASLRTEVCVTSLRTEVCAN